MHIALIAPAWHDPLWESEREKAIFPPLNLITVAGLTPPEHEISLIDEGISKIDFSVAYDLVAITAMTALAPRAYSIADQFRSRGVPVVLGGMHPSALPEEAKEHADAVVIGEAENLWPTLLADFQSGRLKPFYRAAQRPQLFGLVRPRRNLLARERYLVPDTVQITRGCPFACSFCSVSQFFGHSYRFRPVEDVVAEIRELKELGGEVMGFVDDNIVGNPKYARRLFSALAPYKIK